MRGLSEEEARLLLHADEHFCQVEGYHVARNEFHIVDALLDAGRIERCACSVGPTVRVLKSTPAGREALRIHAACKNL